jgi:uncharacterized membrane protein
MSPVINSLDQDGGRPDRPFRKALLGGLGILFPPLFTILIFAWVISTTDRYVLDPVTNGVREVIVLAMDETRTDLDPSRAIVVDGGRTYHRVGEKAFVPAKVYDKVQASPGEPPPTTAKGVYRRYVELTYLRPYIAIPMFLVVFMFLLYLLGRFMAAGMGRFFWNRVEYFIHRVPLVRNVYSSVKQVSDFLFREREIKYTRVVAVEYPRRGTWGLGFVTSEGMSDIRSAVNEPVLSLLVPTSPMPVTGFTVMVRKSETIELNISVDQAFQYIISCGVVVPPQQLEHMRQRIPDTLPKPADSDQSAEPAASG